MNRRIFARTLMGLPILGSAMGRSGSAKVRGHANDDSAGPIRTINFVGKEEKPFLKQNEAELMSRAGRGYLNHMWFGGSFPNYAHLRVRVYVDDESSPSIDMEVGMGVGVGFDEHAAPWGTKWGGITGDPSGVFLNHRIPFGRHIRVTAQLPKGAAPDVPLWWIIRGLENHPLEVNGLPLADNARLRLYKVESLRVEPFGFFDLCNVRKAGAIFQVTIAAKSTSLDFIEAQLRAYVDDAPEPEYLSSGMEDYFLGTYTFNRGMYHLPQAGLTHKDEKQGEISAYRYHDEDPIVFNRAIRLVGRCGEKRGEKSFGSPQATVFSTYTWVYEW